MRHPWLVVPMLLAACAFAKEGGSARKYGSAGCGLGSMAFGAEGSQTSALTTNRITYTQLFGITSGTSNCTEDANEKTASLQERFVHWNLNTLAKEMAQGNGQTLRAYADALGCPESRFNEFASYLQKTHQEILEEPGAVAILEATKAKLQQNEALKNSCERIG